MIKIAIIIWTLIFIITIRIDAWNWVIYEIFNFFQWSTTILRCVRCCNIRNLWAVKRLKKKRIKNEAIKKILLESVSHTWPNCILVDTNHVHKSFQNITIDQNRSSWYIVRDAALKRLLLPGRISPDWYPFALTGTEWCDLRKSLWSVRN